MIKKLGILIMMMSIGNLVHAIESDTIKGVISHIDHAKQTITVSNEQGYRHTYFINDDTQYRSNEKNITVNELKRGQAINATVQHTDLGPELVLFDVLDVDGLFELIPVNIEEKIRLSGEVTGVRPKHSTLTIRDLVSHDRHTFHLSNETDIQQANGAALKLSEIRRGDEVTVLYKQTEKGLFVLTASMPVGTLADAGALSKKSPDGTLATLAVLPKTASSNYVYLVIAMGFAGLGSILWGRRRWLYHRGT